MNKLAKDELVAGTHTSLEEMLSEIDAVTGSRSTVSRRSCSRRKLWRSPPWVRSHPVRSRVEVSKLCL